jgi:hypothetical protein
MPRSSKWSVSFGFSGKVFVRISLHSHECDVPTDFFTVITFGDDFLQITKLLVIQSPIILPLLYPNISLSTLFSNAFNPSSSPNV